jgi:hypothetical protein
MLALMERTQLSMKQQQAGVQGGAALLTHKPKPERQTIKIQTIKIQTMAGCTARSVASAKHRRSRSGVLWD